MGERIDNLKILEEMKREDYQSYKATMIVLENYRKVEPKGAIVIITEDMSSEERELALFEGFLKEGYPPEVAEKKAKEWLYLDL